MSSVSGFNPYNAYLGKVDGMMGLINNFSRITLMIPRCVRAMQRIHPSALS